jgi:hypothetical protein
VTLAGRNGLWSTLYVHLIPNLSPAVRNGLSNTLDIQGAPGPIPKPPTPPIGRAPNDNRPARPRADRPAARKQDSTLLGVGRVLALAGTGR